MRIVKRPGFLTLPAGTVYSTYKPCIFGNLCIKWDRCGANDYVTESLEGCVEANDSGQLVDRCITMAEQGARFPAVFDGTQRDGCYGDDSLMYAIYEPEDVARLIARLREAHAASVGK